MDPRTWNNDIFSSDSAEARRPGFRRSPFSKKHGPEQRYKDDELALAATLFAHLALYSSVLHWWAYDRPHPLSPSHRSISDPRLADPLIVSVTLIRDLLLLFHCSPDLYSLPEQRLQDEQCLKSCSPRFVQPVLSLWCQLRHLHTGAKIPRRNSSSWSGAEIVFETVLVRAVMELWTSNFSQNQSFTHFPAFLGCPQQLRARQCKPHFLLLPLFQL